MIEPSNGPLIVVVGEALIDMLSTGRANEFRARPGGSPFNVAVGLARLGNRTALMARLGDNAFGRMLRDHAVAEGIDLSFAPHATEPTTLAVVSTDTTTGPTYDFYTQGTADWQWSAAEIGRLPGEVSVMHFGSIASWTAPGDAYIHELAERLNRGATTLISYDPNVRPLLLGEPAAACELIERSIRSAHLVKASREDVEWLYPGVTIDDVGARWNDFGAELVIITDGPDGARAYRAGADVLHRSGRNVDVVDTVGAGDAFTSGFLSAVMRRGHAAPGRLRTCGTDEIRGALDEAILVSSLTCEREGADPPHSADVLRGVRLPGSQRG